MLKVNQLNPTPSYTYADIGLKPLNWSNIEHRDQIDTSVKFGPFTLNIPVVAAPMHSVVGTDMAITLAKLGGLAFLPRSNPPYLEQDLYAWVNVIKNIPNHQVIPSIPTIDAIKHFKAFREYGCNAFCIDVANGYAQNVDRTIQKMRDIAGEEIFIVTGNIASVEGFIHLSNMEVDAIRVGIGGGAVCTTSIATGIGVGQASIIREIANYIKQDDCISNNGISKYIEKRKWPLLIADGGIKYPGDIAKAIALGADLVMVGSILAGAKESPGEIIIIGNNKFKTVAGQASFKIRGEKRYQEGGEALVPFSKEVERTWKAFQEGLRSSMSYMNAENLNKMRYLSDEYFVLLSDAAKTERKLHANI